MANATPDITSPGGQVTPVTLVASGQATLLVDVLAAGTPVVFVSSGPATPVLYVSGSPASTFFSAVTAAGGTVSAPRQAIYTTLFNSLTSAGLMTKIQRLGIFAAENAPSCKVDLIDPTKQVTFVGAPTFTVDQGVISLGSTNYVDTNFTAPSPLYTQDSAFHMVGTLGTHAVGADTALLGTAQNSGGSGFYPWSVANTAIAPVNQGSIFATNYANPSTTIKGLYICTRRGALASEDYFNGASKNTSGQASTVPLALSFLIGCWRNTDNVSLFAFDGSTVPCWAVGTQLSAADVTALTNAVNAYMTSVGSPLF